MNKILIMLILLGCNKILLSEKNKEYEEVSLNINELIISAIHDNDLNLLDYYLCKSDNINSSIGDRGTFLHVASEAGNLLATEKLLKLGIEPLIKNEYGKYSYELTNDKDIINTIKDYIIREEVLIAANNKESEIVKILLSENKNVIFLEVKNISLSEELCDILTFKENKEIFSLIIELLKDNFEKTIYVKKRIVEKGLNGIETREELNDYIVKLEELKRLDNNYYPDKNFINNYIKIAVKRGYISEFNILVKLENKKNIVMALLDEFLENNSSFLENFSHNFNFINDIFEKLHLSDTLKKLDKNDNLKNKIWNFLIKNPNMDTNKISKFYNLFIKSMKFKFYSSFDSLYFNGEEKDMKSFLIYNLIDLAQDSISLGYLFLHCLNTNYQNILKYLIHKEIVIDKKGLDNYILEKNLIEKLIKKDDKKTIKKLLEVVPEKIVKEQLFVDYSFKEFNEELIHLLKRRGNSFNKGEYLKASIENQNLEILKLVLEEFKDVDYINREHLLSSICGSKKCNKEIVKLLLEIGADVNDRYMLGRTALMWAAGIGNIEALELLLEKGAKINEKCREGYTALMLASYSREIEIIKLLLKNGADIDMKDEDNFYTALMWAVKDGYKEIIELLLEEKANIHLKNEYGETALSLAITDGKLEVVRLLLEKGANINEKDKEGKTLLMLAANYGYLEVLKLLLEKGANINEKDKCGKTVLMYASENGNLEILKYLKELGA